jgi:DNA-binding transcriptional LysR family regulator
MKLDGRLRRRLKLRDLDTFVTVVECGSMAKAATKLSVSQPAVSNAVAAMERTLGVPLFDRVAQGVELTTYGHSLLKSAASIFDEMQQGMDQISHLLDPTVGELRIGATDPMNAGLLPAILGRLNPRYPRLLFHVSNVTAGRTQVQELRDRRFDLFLGRLTEETKVIDLTREVLFEEHLYVAAGAQNPVTRRRKVGLADLINEPWALPAPDGVLGMLLDSIFGKHGLQTPSAAVVCNSVHLQHELLTSGNFLTFIPNSILQLGAKRSSIKILPIKVTVPNAPVGLARLKHRTVSPMAELFMKAAREVAKNLNKAI